MFWEFSFDSFKKCVFKCDYYKIVVINIFLENGCRLFFVNKCFFLRVINIVFVVDFDFNGYCILEV